MHITDVITAPWAILPEKLLEIQAVYTAHVRCEKIDIAAIEARLGRPLVNDQQGYQNVGGVAVIPVSGVIGKKMNMMTQISGGASTQLIERDIKAALSDSEVNSILLHIDSPGGTVDGTQNLSDVIKAAGEIKPVVSFADGTMASAAYWIGSAADAIVSSSDTTQIGSIGVVATHTDVSKAQEQEGVKTTEISAGKYKRISSQFAPLTKEGKAYMQEQVDQLYTIFVDAVAANRGVDPETVLEDMADGRVFLSKDAMQRGMIDHIATLETTISNMQKGVWPMSKTDPKAAEPVATQPEVLTIEAAKERFPEICSALKAEGAKAERDRIASCEESSLPGFEAIVSAMKHDGKSTGADVAVAIIAEQKKQQASHLDAFVANAPKPVPHAAVDPVAQESSQEDTSLPIEERAKAKWDSDAKLRSEFTSFEGFLGVYKAENSGKLKISAMH